MDENEKPSDPRTAAEDRVRTVFDSMNDFERGTMLMLLSQSGLTFDKALAIRRAEWAKRL